MANDEIVQTEAAPEASAAPRLPEEAQQNVELAAFCHNRFGAKHLDQAAGFVFWARQAGHRVHTVAEWTALLASFSNRPVGAQQS